MIGVNPPGYFLWDAKATDEQIGRFADACSRDAACREQTDDLARSLATTDIPDRWFFLPIKSGNVRVASFYGLMETTQENAPLAAPMTLSSWLSAADGDPSGFWLQSLLADLFFPGSFVWGEYAGAAMLDAQAAKRYFSSDMRESRSNLGRAATTFGWGGGRLSDAWPAVPDAVKYSRVRTSNVETLIVSGELDITTPPQVARKELLPYLPNGEQLVLPGFGHSLDFWTYQPEASTRLLNTFYENGRVDDSLYEAQRVDFTPEVTQTALATGIASTMLGLAVLVLLSLPVMWWRMHRRGRIGRKSSALLRSVYPVVLGLGGWFIGVLLVVTTMPGIPLDDERLAALSIGVPIGLGVYFAWVHRAFPPTRKWAGFALATGGGIAGAWLGFHATVDLLALVTAILGGIVGANLTLILFDMASTRRARDPLAEKSSPARRATRRASTG
jgi:hypothetical protein